MKKILFLAFGLIIFSLAQAQSFQLSGKVTNGKENLPGATVVIKNSNYAAITNADGEFSFSLNPGSYTLVVSYIGFQSKEQNFSILDKDENIVVFLKEGTTELAELEILATRVNDISGFAKTEVTKEDIAKNNLGTDLPYLLDQQPSVVVTSDAGNGVGYTGIRIRGTDPTRVNVTINGIPVNDAESQGVYWVDFPDLASSASSIQVQRGAGTSTNGAGAFGGTVNIQTMDANEKSHAEISNSFGSFNTHKHTLKLGTGKMVINKNDNKYFMLDSRLSWIASDGYIDRAFSNMKSFYVSGGYYSKHSNLRFVAFSGKEKTYQAWYGVPKDSLETNRTYNPYTYEDETDNYIQSNYQLLYNFSLSPKLKGNISFHYTKGAGYYEQYRSGDYFSDYGLDDIMIGGDTIYQSDFIRRLWLDNDFYGVVYTLNYNPSEKLNFILGGGWNRYFGKHYGEIIWAQYAANSNIRQRYYDNDATKTDFNSFLKMNYWVNKSLNIFADMQVRSVNYEFEGFDNNLNNGIRDTSYIFLNPKAGISYSLPKNQMVYASVSVANKEPNRDDFTQSTPSSRPVPESLLDIEAGYKISSFRFFGNINLYYMNYKNQLVLTGKINNVGAYVRQNIGESYRRGVELMAGYNMTRNLSISVNGTFSQNQIKNYVEYIDNWDTWGQDSAVYNISDIAFSPSVIVGGNITYKISVEAKRKHMLLMVMQRSSDFKKEFEIAVLPKYVGKQYIDNTSSQDRMLEGYLVCDGRINLARRNLQTGNYLSLNFTVRNFLNKLYASNAWSYHYIYGGTAYTDYGFYPQAGTNYLVGLTIGF